MKLTKAQRAYLVLLNEAGEDGRIAWTRYRPLVKLTQLGLANQPLGGLARLSRGSHNKAFITDAGRALLAGELP